MARKMQVTHGGVVCKAKKLQTVYGGVVKNAKSAWMVSNGLWRKFFAGSPVVYSFATGGYHYDPAQDPASISSWATVSSLSAGYKDNGDILLSIYTHNSGLMDIGAPSARVTLTFAENLDGKVFTFYFNNSFDTDKSGNREFFEYVQNGTKVRESIVKTYGSGKNVSFTVPAGTTSLSFVMVLGQASTSEYDDYGNVTITSITLDGEEILK